MTTALIFAIPEAEGAVAAQRIVHALGAARGVPAHVTILHPFIPANDVAAAGETLREIFSAVAPFAGLLAGHGRFGREVLYLAPADATPFVRVTEMIAARFPACPPYGGAHDQIVPHLTIADRPGADLGELESATTDALPIRFTLDRSTLIEEGTDGFWRVRAVYPLMGAP